MIEEIETSTIIVGNRYRKDYGDLEALKFSIKHIGLLQPIVIDSDNRLVCGGRRLKAFQELGINKIPARTVSIQAIVLGEYAENEVRKDFTNSERVAIAKAVEMELGNRQGQRTDLPEKSDDACQAELLDSERNEYSKKPSLNLDDVKGVRTDQLAAKKAGFGNKDTYRQAKSVVEKGTPELVSAMDRGDVSIHAASDIVKLEQADQTQVLSDIQRGEKPRESINRVLATKHTGDEESYTPEKFIEAARTVMGSIDCDPASNDMAQKTVKATTYYTVSDDGLKQNWTGNVWLNPPYTARVINEFVSKLCESHQSGDVTQAVLLTNNNTDTRWFHEAALQASAICFTSGRINFFKRDGSTSSPTNGQSFFYFGDDIESFKSSFSDFGLIMVKA